MPTPFKEELKQYPRLAKALRVAGAGLNLGLVFIVSLFKFFVEAFRGSNIELPDAPDMVDYRYEDPDEPEFYQQNKPKSQQSSVIFK